MSLLRQPRRLRGRITLWFVVISLLLYGVAALSIIGLGLRNSRRDLGLLLYAEAEGLASYYSTTGRLDFPELSAISGHTPIPVWLRVIRDGQVVAATPGTPMLPILSKVATEEGQMISIASPDGGSMAVVRHEVWNRGQASVEAIASQNLLSTTMRHLGLALVLTPLLLIPLAILGGRLLAAGVVRPLSHLIDSIRAVDSRNLTQRLEAPGSVREIDDLAHEFNALLERLEMAVGRMRRFTADASHELRTPVSILRTGIEVALRKPREAIEYQQLASECLVEIDRVQRTVEGLLTLAREEPGNEAAAPTVEVDLSAEAREAMRSLATMAAERRVELISEIEPEVTLLGERDRLRLVLVNLLDNALRHTPAGKQVRLELAQENGQVRLRVADQGPGVATEDRPHIFERFYRGGDGTSPNTGGLGLSVVRWVVEHHGGTVAVLDGEEPGAVFEVRLPRHGGGPALT